jgi:predicted  nucleic acid-binding Zn-ribbon protein
MKTPHTLRPLLACAALLACALALPATAAAEPVQVPLQGLLTDADGRAIDGDTTITFSVYAGPEGGEALWSSQVEVPVDGGLFTVMLGAQDPLDSDLFHANPGATVSLRVDGDVESTRIPLGHLPLAAHAASATSADDAQTLQGLTPDDLRSVTAADVSYDDADGKLEASDTQAALAKILARVEALEADRDALSGNVTALQTANTELTNRVIALETDLAAAQSRLGALEAADVTQATAISDLDASVSALSTTVSGFASRITTVEGGLAALDARVDTVDTRSATNAGAVSTLQTNVAGVQSQVTGFAADVQSNSADVAAVVSSQSTQDTRLSALEAKTASMSTDTIDGRAAVVFDAVNLHLRSGSGSTAGTVNGLGNLVIGYDEARTTGSDKSGSHNIVFGRLANYTSFGGLVGGSNNAVTGSYASILTGSNNEATSTYSVVIAGSSNDSTGTSSVVVTGSNNEATSGDSVVISGSSNDSTGTDSVVVSGSSNVAEGTTSVVVSGFDNDSSGWRSIVVGGTGNRAGLDTSDNYPVTVGGSGNAANGSNITISGGLNRTETNTNTWRGGTLTSQ